MLQDNQGASSSGRDRECHASDFDKPPLVSVIIPTRNSGRTIAECLRSIISQSYRPVEIIVVDGFSTDSTKAIAKSMGALVISRDGERSLAKNFGAKFAKGRYLYFVDADQKLCPDVIEACVKMSGKVDAVLINDQDLASDSTMSRLVASRRRILSYDPLNVAPRFVRKAAFERLGGFDSDLYAGEDLDLHRRFLLNNFKVTYSHATVWHLGSPADSKELVNRSMYYSSNYLRYVSKNPLVSVKRMNPLRVVTAWRRSGVRGTDLLPVVLLGFLSNALLMIGVLLNLNTHEVLRKRAMSLDYEKD